MPDWKYYQPAHLIADAKRGVSASRRLVDVIPSQPAQSQQPSLGSPPSVNEAVHLDYSCCLSDNSDQQLKWSFMKFPSVVHLGFGLSDC